MGKIIWSTLAGAVYGAMVAVCLYVVGFVLEIFNLGCAILTCDCDKPMMFDWSGMWNLLFIFAIAGAVIGFFYRIYKIKADADADAARLAAENSEEARKQRIKWASDIKQKALDLNNTCFQNKKIDIPIVSTTYKASVQMTEIMNELTKVAEKQGKIDFLVNELSTKGGTSV